MGWLPCCAPSLRHRKGWGWDSLSTVRTEPRLLVVYQGCTVRGVPSRKGNGGAPAQRCAKRDIKSEGTPQHLPRGPGSGETGVPAVQQSLSLVFGPATLEARGGVSPGHKSGGVHGSGDLTAVSGPASLGIHHWVYSQVLGLGEGRGNGGLTH